jgi:hypothetical protein
MNNSDNYTKDEISLKELIEYFGAYFGALKKGVIFILILGIASAAISYLYFSSKPVNYQARLSFMLNEDESNPISGMNSILGQFGLPVINQRVNISKLLELTKSRKIIQDALFEKKKIDGKNTYLANHFIEAYEMSDGWSSEYPEMKEFMFSHDSIESFNNYENFALQSLCTLIGGTPANRSKALLETDFGQNTTIMSYVVNTRNELISYHLTNCLFEATSDFYIDKSIERQKTTYEVLVVKRDSLRKEYDRLEFLYADLSDRATGLFSKKQDIKRDRTRAEMLQLSSGLAKLEENIAFVEFSIEDSTPILQVIDAPLLPLKELKVSAFMSIFLGFAAGTILGSLMVLFRKFYALAKE